jgi:two-component system cell cycle response regulator
MTSPAHDKSPAVPGIAFGAAALAVGLAGFVLDDDPLALLAGGLALLAGLWSLYLAKRLSELNDVHRLVGDELRSVRAESRAKQAELETEIGRLTSASEKSTRRADTPSERANDDRVFEAHLDEALGPDFIDTGIDAYNDGDADDLFGADGEPLDHPAPGVGLDPLSDPVSGLFNEVFYVEMLSARVAAARRHLRPVAAVILEVVDGLPGDQPKPANPDTVTEAIVSTLRESDTAARLQNGTYAFLLEDTPENGAIWTVERVRRQLATDHPNLSLRAGVACYPAHAFSAAELIGASHDALEAARDWRQDRIEVAASVPD